MTTFVLRKYNPAPEQTAKDSAGETQTREEKKEEPEQMMKIRTSATISQVIAMALYKSLPNNVHVQEVDDKQAEEVKAEEANVISTEDINLDPVKTFQSLSGKSTVAILGKGFSTEKDEWFLTNMQNRNVQSFYTVPGLINHVKKTLGV